MRTPRMPPWRRLRLPRASGYCLLRHYRCSSHTVVRRTWPSRHSCGHCGSARTLCRRWHRYPGGNGHVNWDESWARRRGRFGTYTVYRIMTPRDEVLCLIPASSRPRMDSTKARITLKELLERVIEQIPFFPPEERTHGWKAKWNEQAAAAINKLRKDKKPTSARSVGARMNQYKLWPE